MGVGVGITDDDGPVYLIAYVTPDEDAAAATAAAVEELVTEGESLVTREPWSDRLTVDAVETDGAVALALRYGPPSPGRSPCGSSSSSSRTTSSPTAERARSGNTRRTLARM